MRETIERRTCDACGKVAEHDPTTFGPMPFCDWQQVMHWDGRPFTAGYLDACSPACAIDLLTNGPRPKINIDLKPKEQTP